MPEDLTSSAAPLAEIPLGPSKLEQFLDRNLKGLIILLCAALLATVVYIVMHGIKTSNERSAGANLSKANDVAALREVVDQHANTNAAESAKLLLADKLWSDGQQSDSIKTLRDFIATNTNHPAKPTASAKLAAKLMMQGNAAEAVSIFEELSSDPNARYIAPYALICLGDIAKSSGNLPKAENHYNKVKTEFPDSGFANLAHERLTLMKASPPVEIEPPAQAPEGKNEKSDQPSNASKPATGNDTSTDPSQNSKNLNEK
jgi:predicted negative regulator of RcsB-dependent stress response